MIDGWKTYKLGGISSTITYGYTESASTEEIGPKFLRITDIQNSFISWNNVPYCPISNKDFEKYKLEIGDIVIARTGNSTGANAIIKDEINAVYASYLIRYQIDKNKADPTFVAYNLRSKKWFDYVDAIKGGSAQPGANAQQFAQFELTLPPFQEQTAIASILSALDDKIELNLQQNKTLEEMAMALYKHWFVDFGPFKEGNFIDSELGRIPEGWEVSTIGELYDTTSGGTPSRKRNDFYEGGNIPWVKSKELHGDYIIETEEKITELGLKNSSAKLITKGSILLAMYGATVGETSILSFDATCNQAICGILQKQISNIYVYLFLTINKEEVLNQAVGSAQQNISQVIIKNIKILKPQNDLKCFSDLELYFNQIEQNRIENKELISLRDSLLPKLISGEILVKDLKNNLKEVL